jgi:hypothetical protein
MLEKSFKKSVRTTVIVLQRNSRLVKDQTIYRKTTFCPWQEIDVARREASERVAVLNPAEPIDASHEINSQSEHLHAIFMRREFAISLRQRPKRCPD